MYNYVQPAWHVKWNSSSQSCKPVEELIFSFYYKTPNVVKCGRESGSLKIWRQFLIHIFQYPENMQTILDAYFSVSCKYGDNSWHIFFSTLKIWRQFLMHIFQYPENMETILDAYYSVSWKYGDNSWWIFFQYRLFQTQLSELSLTWRCVLLWKLQPNDLIFFSQNWAYTYLCFPF